MRRVLPTRACKLRRSSSGGSPLKGSKQKLISKGRVPRLRSKTPTASVASASAAATVGSTTGLTGSLNPLRQREVSLSAKGYEIILGVDEAGRGPLAGPVVAASCSIPLDLDLGESVKIGDSKQLSEEEREAAYEVITTNPKIKWSASIIDEKVIDDINILQATFRAVSPVDTVW